MSEKSPLPILIGRSCPELRQMARRPLDGQVNVPDFNGVLFASKISRYHFG